MHDHEDYVVVYLTDVQGKFTMPDGSRVFGKFEGLPGSAFDDGKARGTWTLTGGTGMYEGVKGGGSYIYTPIDDSRGTDILEGEIELP